MVRLYSPRGSFYTVMLVMIMNSAVAQTATEPSSGPTGFTPSVQSLHQQVQSNLQWLANTADWLLGGTRADDVRNRSTLRIHTDFRVREYARPDHGFHVQWVNKIGVLERWKVRAQGWLRDEERKVEGYVESKVKGSVDSSKGEVATTEPSLNPSQGVVNPWHFNLDKKVRIHQPKTVSASIRARIRRDLEEGQWLYSLSSGLGWSSPKIWEAQLSADIYRHLAQSWLLTIGNSISYDLNHSLLSTSHGPTVSRILSHYQAVSIGATISTAAREFNHRWQVSGYAIPLVYRTEFTRTGLFASLSPALSFVRANNFRGEASILLSLQQVF